MQEIICLHIGQAGIQISNAAWELFCIEHGIQSNGHLKDLLREDDSEAFRTFFNESINGNYIPRALTVDLEPTVVDEVRTGAYRNLFHPDQLLNIYEDSSNNFARGHHTVGKTFLEIPMDVLRRIVETCDGLQGFFLLHSHGGGTGSGYTALILETLEVEYSKSLRFQFSIYPSSVLSTAIVEPYNCLLSFKSDIENSDITSLINNEAVFHICSDLLSVTRPTFSNINRVISHGFSDLTVSLRFESSLSANFCQMSTNLIPYPRIHFPLMSHAPFTSEAKAYHETGSTNQITRSVFNSTNQLISCDTKLGLYMSCVLQYRGEVTPKDVNAAIFKIKRGQEIKFVDWCPTGFKLGISSQPSIRVPSSEMAQTNRSVTMITNNTAIKDPIESMMEKFDFLFHKKSFVQWFVGEGMEESEFNEARDASADLILDFVEISTFDESNGQQLNGELSNELVTQGSVNPKPVKDDLKDSSERNSIIAIFSNEQKTKSKESAKTQEKNSIQFKRSVSVSGSAESTAEEESENENF